MGYRRTYQTVNAHENFGNRKLISEFMKLHKEEFERRGMKHVTHEMISDMIHYFEDGLHDMLDKMLVTEKELCEENYDHTNFCGVHIPKLGYLISFRGLKNFTGLMCHYRVKLSKRFIKRWKEKNNIV